LLRPVGDLERLTSRAALGHAHARDLVGLRACLEPLDDVRAVGGGLESSLLAAATTDLADLASLRALLEAALADEPPLALHDGGLIRESWNAALAAIVDDAQQAREWIAGLEERERARTRIPSLRVRFNRVFGYGIEVTHAHAARAPAEVAHARGHVRPVVDRGEILAVADGRHPALEARPGAVVTPNDLELAAEAPIVILTGPNMSGKSVYLRQTAHVVIMAQIGAW